MTQLEKLYQSIRRNPKDVEFRDLKRLLESYGFIVQNKSGGSHYTVYHPGMELPMYTIPKHGKVKPQYVRNCLQWIDEVRES